MVACDGYVGGGGLGGVVGGLGEEGVCVGGVGRKCGLVGWGRRVGERCGGEVW